MDYAGIITTTAQSLAPYVVDGVHNGSVLPARLLTKVDDWDEGQYKQQPIQVEESTQGGDFVGMQPLDVGAENLDVNMKWTPTGKAQPIVVPWVEVAHNKTKAGVIKLVSRKIDVAKNAIVEKSATTLASLGGGSAWEGLDKMTDDSALSSEYGTLSRTTYGAAINGQSNAVATWSLSAIGTQLDACTPANSSMGTTLMISTKTIWGYTESLLDPKSRQMYDNVPTYVSAYTPNGGAVKSAELGGASGFTAIFHRGIPMVKEEKVGTGKTYFLNESMIDFARLELPQLKSISLSNEATKGVWGEGHMPTAFQQTDFLRPYNQLGEIGHIIGYGQLINRDPRHSGVTTGTVGI
jgi:hypothetical protein